MVNQNFADPGILLGSSRALKFLRTAWRVRGGVSSEVAWGLGKTRLACGCDEAETKSRGCYNDIIKGRKSLEVG